MRKGLHGIRGAVLKQRKIKSESFDCLKDQSVFEPIGSESLINQRFSK